ncbi:hypothetical protein LINPERPRIM_LOCUS2258 [Linum perenne]
MKILG